MTLQEQIAVMQAFEDGKEIEMKFNDGTHWSFVKDPTWNWSGIKYRIKLEPEFTYPIWCKSLPNKYDKPNSNLIVKFTSLREGTVVSSNIDSLPVGHFSSAWFLHTATSHWEQVQEPKLPITLLECVKAPDALGKYTSDWITQAQYDATRPGVYIKVLRTIQLED